MSAPQTNIDKQKRWHRGPLIGIIVVLLFVGAIFFYWLMYEARNASDGSPKPESLGTGSATQDSGTTAPSP